MKNKNEKLGFTGNKQDFLRVFVLLLIGIFLLLFIYIVGALFITRDHFKSGTNPSAYFKNCKILKEKCVDAADCNFYAYCGGGERKDCKIYDCGEEYGIYSVDISGKTSMEKKKKFDDKAAEDKIEACKGGMDILEQKCVEDETQVTVKLLPNGSCPIVGFRLFYENEGAQLTTFETLGGDIYVAKAPRCGKVEKIIPIVEGGISLEF